MHINSMSLLGLGEEERIKNEPAFYLVQGATVFQSVNELSVLLVFTGTLKGSLVRDLAAYCSESHR